MKKLEPLCIADGNVENDAIIVKQHGTVSKINKKELPYMSSTLLQDICPNKLKAEIQTDACMPVNSSSISNIHLGLNTQMFLEEWMNTIWHVQEMEYYPVSKGKEILTHATTQVNTEDNMLSKINELQQGSYCRIPLQQALRFKNSEMKRHGQLTGQMREVDGNKQLFFESRVSV